MYVENMTPAELNAIWGDLEAALRRDGLFHGITVHGRICTHRTSDGLLSCLNVGRIDGSIDAVLNSPLSMTVRGFGTAVHVPHLIEIGQMKEGDIAPRVTVCRPLPDGKSDPLSPDQTLLEANLHENDRIEVFNEATAGVHPQTREEALARVRIQVLEYARAHPEFHVSANSTLAPTENLFQFKATGIQPAEASGGQPVLIHEHEVLLVLPAEFPMKAPLAFWQTPLFHPNIHPDSGFVCLGELQDKYRPGLHFGQLCQMLVDMAAFKNYELSPNLNPEAARWLASSEGQHMLVQVGGKLWQQDLFERLVTTPIRLKMKRIDS
jgi:ubiquitin-protein ligase